MHNAFPYHFIVFSAPSKVSHSLDCSTANTACLRDVLVQSTRSIRESPEGTRSVGVDSLFKNGDPS